MNETVRKDIDYFRRGDRVMVNGRGPNDSSQQGRAGTFLDYVHTGSGNMARVALDPKAGWLEQEPGEDRWILHPESLDKL